MEQIKSYLDGELDLAQQAEVETHLRNDADLQKMVEDFRVISASLKTADAGEPYGAEKVVERLASAQNAQKDSNKRIWRLAYIWSGAAACLALLTLFFFPVYAQTKVSAKKYATAGADVAAKAADPNSDPTLNFKSDASPAAEERAKSSFGLPQDGKRSGKQNSDENPVNSPAGAVAGEPAPSSDTVGGQPGGGFAGGGVTAKKSPSAGADQFQPIHGMTTQNGTSFSGRGTDKELAKTATPSVPESQFKQGMRQIRDNSVKSDGNTQNDTPHGIYLERSGTISLKVEDLMRSVDETTGMVQSLNGFVVGHELQNEEDGGTATMTVRVPTPSFNAAMNKLQAMGDVIAVNSASQDITTPMVESSTSMISWADEEKRLMDELAKAKNNDEKYRIRQQLAQTRVNLNVQRESVKSLKQRADFSTINITFLRGDKAVKAGGSSNWSGSAFRDAKSGLSSVGQVLGVIGIYFLVFCPIWLPFVIAALVIRKKNQG